MRITLDTDNKVVTLLHEVGFKEVEQIKKIIGEGWKEWKVVPHIQLAYYPNYINTPFIITCDTATTTNEQPLVTFTAGGN